MVNELARDQQEGWQDRSGTPRTPQPRLMLDAVYKAHLSHLWAPHDLCPFSSTSHNPLHRAPLNKQAAKGEGVHREGGDTQVLG